jgi:hypothetical protein
MAGQKFQVSGFKFQVSQTTAIVRWVLVAAFIFLIARHWHSYYGFTGLLQIDARMAQSAVPAVHDDRIFIHQGAGSYDGGQYAQLATSPALADPALRPALDDLGYRARRILLSAVAWVLGGGDPVAALQAYAWLNIVLWFGLAALLWRVFPVADWRGTAAWVGVMFGAGVMFSVRLALTDLAALLLIAGAVVLVERGRSTLGAALLGLAGLARETAVLGAAALGWSSISTSTTDRRASVGMPLDGLGVLSVTNGETDAHRTGEGTRPTEAEIEQPARRSGSTNFRFLLRLALQCAIVALPLGLWLLYVHHAVGGSSAGQRNLGWPLAGWWDRWAEMWGSREALGNPRLFWESVLEHVALTAQVVYLAWRPRRECPWWRVGAAYAVLCLGLGGAVWGGFPNATSRVLLPLTLAFNVRAVRDRARWGWFILGNLSLFAGFQAVQQPVALPHDLPAGSSWSSRHLLTTDERWSATEWNSKHRWAWSAGEGGVTLRTWPQRERATVELQLRGRTPRMIEVRHAGTVVWRGSIGDRPEWITLPELPLVAGRLDLELRSETPATAEGADNTARSISFACFGARLAGD